MTPGNLLANLPQDTTQEHFEDLLQAPNLRLERIVSHGQASPPGFWYDQPQHEWVLVLQGQAGLEIEGQPGIHELNPGDHAHLPAHCRHRVAWTDPSGPTVWLAVHYGEGSL